MSFRLRHAGQVALGHGPQGFYFIDTVPNSRGQSGTKGDTKRRGFLDFGFDHGNIEHVGLKLHYEIVGRTTAIIRNEGEEEESTLVGTSYYSSAATPKGLWPGWAKVLLACTAPTTGRGAVDGCSTTPELVVLVCFSSSMCVRFEICECGHRASWRTS